MNAPKSKNRARAPKKSRKTKTAAAPQSLEQIGPGSAEELLSFLADIYVPCGYGCTDHEKCEHKFSLNHGWKYMVHLSYLPDAELAKLPASVQSRIQELKHEQRELEKLKQRTERYLPKKGRDRWLMIKLSDAFATTNRAKHEFCTAWAYAKGSADQRYMLTKRYRAIGYEDCSPFDMVYLHDDWELFDRDRRMAESAKSAVNGARSRETIEISKNDSKRGAELDRQLEAMLATMSPALILKIQKELPYMIARARLKSLPGGKSADEVTKRS